MLVHLCCVTYVPYATMVPGAMSNSPPPPHRAGDDLAVFRPVWVGRKVFGVTLGDPGGPLGCCWVIIWWQWGYLYSHGSFVVEGEEITRFPLQGALLKAIEFANRKSIPIDERKSPKAPRDCAPHVSRRS